MSAQLRRRSVSAQSNQFIRPTSTIITIDTVSAARRMASRGSSFRASDEVAAAVMSHLPCEVRAARPAAAHVPPCRSSQPPAPLHYHLVRVLAPIPGLLLNATLPCPSARSRCTAT